MTDDGRKVLAGNLSPKGATLFDLKAGTKVVVNDEMKPSELKVLSISRDGGTPIAIEHGKPGRRDETRRLILRSKRRP